MTKVKPWIRRLIRVLAIITFPTFGLWGLGHYPVKMDITHWIIHVKGMEIAMLWENIKDWKHQWGAYWVVGLVIFIQWVLILLALRLIYEVIVYIIYGDKDQIEVSERRDVTFPNKPRTKVKYKRK